MLILLMNPSLYFSDFMIPPHSWVQKRLGVNPESRRYKGAVGRLRRWTAYKQKGTIRGS